jgi:hypothetical protein
MMNGNEALFIEMIMILPKQLKINKAAGKLLST